MFGYYKAKREIKKLKNEREKPEPGYVGKTPEQIKEQSQSNLAERRARGEQNRKEAESKATDYLKQDFEGLSPEKRSAMQYAAQSGINRNYQMANRKLLGEQGRRGIVGRGGIGYAQQRDLSRLNTEAQAGVHRDLDQLNSDLALKKQAAHYAMVQGELNRAQFDEDAAIRELKDEEERNENRFYRNKYSNQLQRI